MKRRISIRAIILHDGKLFCVQQKQHAKPGNHVNDYWNLPGGGLEEGEALLDCLRRELVEETNVVPVSGNLMYVQQFEYDGMEHLEFFFHVTNAADYLQLDISQTTHGGLELADYGFVDPKQARVLPKFLATEDLIAQTNRPAKIFSRP